MVLVEDNATVEKTLKSDLDLLAPLVIEYLADQPDPFEHLSDQEYRLDDNYRDVVIAGIHGYQIFTYFQLLTQYLGEVTAGNIRQLFLAGLRNNGSPRQGLDVLLSLIDTAYAIGAVEIEGLEEVETFPVEFSMALTLLLCLVESPHYTPGLAQRQAEIQRMDINLDKKFSHYLKQARKVITEKFSPILSRILVEKAQIVN